MAQELYLLQPELTFRQLPIQLMLSENPQNHSEMFCVFFSALKIDQYIINKNYNKLIQIWPENMIHIVHEYGRRISHPKRHHHILVVAIARPKSCLLHILRPN